MCALGQDGLCLISPLELRVRETLTQGSPSWTCLGTFRKFSKDWLWMDVGNKVIATTSTLLSRLQYMIHKPHAAPLWFRRLKVIN